MNEVSWLQPKNASQPAPSQPQKPDGAADKGTNFAAFLSGENHGSGAVGANQQGQLSGQTARAPAIIPSGSLNESAVDRAGAGASDALTIGNNRAPAFFAATSVGQVGFRAAPQVSDEAIAFNARPIVGPASFSHSPDEVFAAIEGVDAEAFAAARSALAGSLGVEDGHLAITPDAAEINNAGRVQSTKAATPRSTPVPGSAVASTQGGRAAGVDALAQPLAGGNSAKSSNTSEANARGSSRTASTTQLLPVQMAAAQTPAFAQVLATPSEYRLVIRGQRLSEDMRELVMRAVRGGLAEYGLPQMPLAVFEQEGRR